MPNGDILMTVITARLPARFLRSLSWVQAGGAGAAGERGGRGRGNASVCKNSGVCEC